MIARPKFLIVEESFAIRALLREILERCGAEVTTAESRQEALEMLAQTRPVLILLDPSSTAVGGLSILRDIRQAHGFEAVPIVLISSSGEVPSPQRVLELGANVALPKPFTVYDLWWALDRLGFKLPPPEQWGSRGRGS